MMKLVQKILSHGLFIAFVVAAFFLYNKRAELFPQWFANAQAPVAVSASEQPSTAPAKAVSRPKPEKVIGKQPVAPVVDDSAAPEEAVAVDSRATDAPSQSLPGASLQPPVETAAAVPDAQAGVASAGVPAPTAAAAVPSPAAAAPELSEEQGAQLQQQLAQARTLYWRKDIRGAELIYQSLGQAHPQNPDVWGEAGNFYYSLQRREQAIDAYSRAFDLLMRQGQQQRADQLQGVMHQLDEEKARALEMQLQQPGG